MSERGGVAGPQQVASSKVLEQSQRVPLPSEERGHTILCSGSRACWRGATSLAGDLALAFDSWLCSVVLVEHVWDGQMLVGPIEFGFRFHARFVGQEQHVFWSWTSERHYLITLVSLLPRFVLKKIVFYRRQAVLPVCAMSNIEMWWQGQGVNCIFVLPMGTFVF